MTTKQAYLDCAKIAKRQARRYSKLASEAEKEPLKMWVSKIARSSTVSGLAGISLELYYLAQEFESKAAASRTKR